MKIAKFVKTTTKAWEGRDSCCIVISGCNMRCPCCCNPGCIDDCKTSIEELAVFDYIDSRNGSLDAAIVSGGEPLCNPDLYRFLKDLKKHSIPIELDTNGYYPDKLDDLIGAEYVDRVNMNVMAPLDECLYSKAAGTKIDINRISRCIDVIIDSGIDHCFNTVAVPEIIDGEGIKSIGHRIKGAKEYILRQFDPRNCVNSDLKIKRRYTQKEAQSMIASVRKYVKNVKVRGF